MTAFDAPRRAMGGIAGACRAMSVRTPMPADSMAAARVRILGLERLHVLDELGVEPAIDEAHVDAGLGRSSLDRFAQRRAMTRMSSSFFFAMA